jgi:ribulose-phosphate 3-epimerase
MKKLIAASILSADPLKLAAEVAELERSGIDMLHIDIMDGHFVPNLTFGSNIVKALKQITTIPLDVHLMVQNPENHITSFIEAGADFLTVHLEAVQHLDKTLNKIKEQGAKAGVALLPSTLPNSIDYVLDIVDLVLVMTVNPGFSGQKFIANQLDKIRILSGKINAHTLLSVDGGINDQTIKQVSNMGANLFVSGSYIYQNNSIYSNLQQLKSIISL